MQKLMTAGLGLILYMGSLGCQEKKPEYTFVAVETDLGRIVLRLYDDTPVHKENFISLVKKGYYDGVIFHRVVQDFIVQAGDPNTKEGGANPSDKQVNYTLKSELSLDHVHTQGKLAAAREPDETNPEKRSSGSQFFIVTGRPVSPEELVELETNRNTYRRAALYQEFQKIEQNPDTPIDFELFLAHKGFKDLRYYDPEKQADYARFGGAPHLDFEYTIFGEVADGMDVVKRIEQVPTEGERPLKAIRITSARVMAHAERQQPN